MPTTRGYTAKAFQGEPLGCVTDERLECAAGFACEHTPPMSEERWRCLRQELLLNKPTPRRNEKFVVVKQASFGMVNSFRGGLTTGVLLAALTHRRIVLDWPDVSRNWGALPPARFYPARQPEPNEWWLGANTSTWSESGMERRDAKGAALEEVRLERARHGSNFLEVQAGATSLPLSPGAIQCAARLFGSSNCATNVRCVQGAAYRVLLAEPTPRFADRLRVLPLDVPSVAERETAATVVGLHLRSWPTAMEGHDAPPRKMPIEDWARAFFDCADAALDQIPKNPALVVYFATDEPAFRVNATARFPNVVFGDDAVTHTRTAPKRGALPRSARGGDAAVLDWFTLADASRVFVGTRASTFSDAIIDRGCLGRLHRFFQLGSSGDCGQRTCADALNLRS